ncbi:MAG: 23S rRNA (pseudouridine(1915)-N(3))-methyltransferase RlmH [Vallitaleaceae bacterium]|jgi:23S rRNA (pseudouridine1915-N3)-methyltransferase|nr:23S rRNA (pseudouridine(1915)-N(3))-methyltransferase RlmH [Vallitaleaceae bacterium]
MNIKQYVINDKPKRYYQDAILEYQKRLSRYCKISLILVKSVDKLIKKIPITNAYTLCVTSKGTPISSGVLAEKISHLGLSGQSNLNIILGSDDSVNHLINENIAITTMDMDSGLMTTIIFEQIFRAYRIINNHAYHK